MTFTSKVILTSLLGYVVGALIGLALVLSDADASVVELHDVGLTYQRFVGTPRDGLYPDSPKKEQYQLGLGMDLFDVVGMDASILAGTNQAQFHAGGIEYYTYVRLTQEVQVGVRHESLHIFDSAVSGGFPLENSVQVRMKLFDRNYARKELF